MLELGRKGLPVFRNTAQRLFEADRKHRLHPIQPPKILGIQTKGFSLDGRLRRSLMSSMRYRLASEMISIPRSTSSVRTAAGQGVGVSIEYGYRKQL
jgi:hypothetical protein